VKKRGSREKFRGKKLRKMQKKEKKDFRQDRDLIRRAGSIHPRLTGKRREGKRGTNKKERYRKKEGSAIQNLQAEERRNAAEGGG